MKSHLKRARCNYSVIIALLRICHGSSSGIPIVEVKDVVCVALVLEAVAAIARCAVHLHLDSGILPIDNSVLAKQGFFTPPRARRAGMCYLFRAGRQFLQRAVVGQDLIVKRLVSSLYSHALGPGIMSNII